MESFAKLRWRHLVKGVSISAIARDLNLSRNTGHLEKPPRPRSW